MPSDLPRPLFKDGCLLYQSTNGDHCRTRCVYFEKKEVEAIKRLAFKGNIGSSKNKEGGEM